MACGCTTRCTRGAARARLKPTTGRRKWAEGLKQRFGLIHIDYATQKRTIKNSGKWYRDFLSGFLPKIVKSKQIDKLEDINFNADLKISPKFTSQSYTIKAKKLK